MNISGNTKLFTVPLKAADLVYFAERTDLIFDSYSPYSAKAEVLLSPNNVKSLICKNPNGTISSEIQFTNVYDDDNYLIFTTVYVLTDEVITYTFNFKYK